MTTKERLAAYAREVGIDKWTLESLINSHRRLRSLNMDVAEERRRTLDEAYKFGLKEGRKEALEKEYVSIERLSKMTLSEIVGLLMGK